MFQLHDYQAYSVDHILQHKQSGLFLDMGLGKTVTTLTAIDKLMYDMFAVHKVLIIAPLRVAEDTWSREVEKWEHLRHLTLAKILGPKEKRLEALQQNVDIYVINRENVEWLVEQIGNKWPFDMVVIDELSSFKSPKAKRFKALRKVRGAIKRIVGLTGTPAPNGLLDLWPQMYLLDGGERLGKTVTQYRDNYFIPARRNGHIVYEWKLKQQSEEKIKRKISDICISMKAKDFLNLPERIDNEIKVNLSPTIRKLYKKLEKELLLPFLDGDIVADSAAVLTNKLLQMCNGCIYDENGNVKQIHDVKLKALDELVEAAQGQPILCFYNYKHDASQIMSKFPQAKMLGGSDDIAKWNRGEIPLLLAHPASAGHGLNLQDGGNIVVWYSLTWSLELYQQANARLHRQGQKRSVVIHHILVKDSMDEAVLSALQKKEQGQDALLAALKARVKKVQNEKE